MHVELWGHFKTVLTSIWPLLTYDDKQVCNSVVKWANNLGNHYTDIPSLPINQIKDWLKEIRDQYTGQVRTDLTNAITFLTRLNLKPLPGYYQTQAACSRFGFYFYDGVCNEQPRRIPAPPLPPPKPPPPPVPPVPIPPEFLTEEIDLTLLLLAREDESSVQMIYKNATDYLDTYDRWLGEANWEWSWDMAMQQAANEGVLAGITKPIVEWVNKVVGVLGDVNDLEGKTIVELLLKSGTGASDMLDLVMDEIGVYYTPAINDQVARVDLSGGGMMENLHDIIIQWEDLEKQLGGITLADVDKQITGKYKVMVGTIDGINAKLDYILTDLGITTEEVTVNFDDLILDEVEALDHFMFATVAYTKLLVKTAAEKILDIVAEPIIDILDNQKIIIRSVIDISDEWLAKLKGKLGDVGGEYDLGADTVFQEVEARVTTIEETINELPDEWVEVLANRLQGYFSTGIGEKGEKGDPGLPGAQGIQGIPGVKGEPGEPGEGAGLAIDDINRQLKDQLVQGQAIITTNVTGVIDYNIEKIGELFTRYDLEVKPITEFLTTDMQDTLTMIAESFETPEALIAFLLDVPEGQEDVTYDLMQMLIAQIMERGLE